jgi:hypothetical protein
VPNLSIANVLPHVTPSVPARRDSGFHLVLVSFMAEEPYEPRGVRTRAILNELEQRCSVEVVSRPLSADRRDRMELFGARRLGGYLVKSLFIDKFEPRSRRQFRSWNPSAHGALLVGWPWSPVAIASRRLSLLEIPYVVDSGDPWALTNRRPETHALGLLRSRLAETRMWSGSAGAVVTTAAQRDALQAEFPALPILIRPNGLEIAFPGSFQATRNARRKAKMLRLAHFGAMHQWRIDVRPLLDRIAREGPWDGLELTQFGADWRGALKGLTGEIDVRFHDPLPWPEVVRRAGGFDAALVIGNLDPGQLPSKVVSYLSLPIPRIAVTLDPTRDALGTYLHDKGGWLVLRPDATDAAELVRRHVSRDWSAAELAPPSSESWEVVAAEVADFVLTKLELSRVDAHA